MSFKGINLDVWLNRTFNHKTGVCEDKTLLIKFYVIFAFPYTVIQYKVWGECSFSSTEFLPDLCPPFSIFFIPDSQRPILCGCACVCVCVRRESSIVECQPYLLTHPCTSISVRTFRNILHYPASYPKPSNQPNLPEL